MDQISFERDDSLGGEQFGILRRSTGAESVSWQADIDSKSTHISVTTSPLRYMFRATLQRSSRTTS